ncbi:MAG: O-antigen ligase family protein, partial [Planctomycetota bacterium]
MPPMPWLDPLLALLLLLPAAWLATPGTLTGHSEPELTATGWWVLLQLAPALLLLLRKPRPAVPLLTLYAGFVAISRVIFTLRPPSDTLSASRAVLIAIASWSALSAGAALGVQGRRVLSYGLIGLSVALSLSALGGISPRFQGALQNSGATSEAALLGALASLALWLSPDRPARILALVATIGYGIFVALAPVIAGALCFVSVGALACILRRQDRRGIAVALGTFLLAVGATLLVARSGFREPEDSQAPASQEVAAAPGGDLGGFAVRLSVGARTLAMFADHPWVGVGPGQFRAQFPPYRAEKERLASNQAAGAGRESEVEHAHDDFLTTLAEVGIV